MAKRDKKAIWLLVLCICNLIWIAGFMFVFIRENYPDRIAAKIRQSVYNTVPTPHNDALVKGWSNSLSDVSADIAFYGDSIVAGARNAFPEENICNLGVGGDTIAGLIQRLPLIDAINAKKVFLMVGINDIYNASENLETLNMRYDELLTALQERGLEVYVHSILPVREPSGISNPRIVEMNAMLRDLAAKHRFTYVDLHNRLVDDTGAIDAAYVKEDGVHITQPAYDIWYSEIAQYIEGE